MAVSEQLASFSSDFESKILRPVREKRAAGDEILAIQPVAPGVRSFAFFRGTTGVRPERSSMLIHAIGE